MPNSKAKVWWVCSKKHEWQATILNRYYGTKCPYCSRRKPLKGETDLVTENPDLAMEWNYSRNGNDLPEHFMVNSTKSVWWICINGHKWKKGIQGRNKGSGCPYCSGKKPIKGQNDLLTLNCKLCEEWNYDKNFGLYPENYMPNSMKKVWWKCKYGHEWFASINNRNRGTSCPYCRGLKPIIGVNDLVSQCPEIVREWDYEKNKNLNPRNYLPKSGAKVWWKCENGHEWKATIRIRTSGSLCKECKKMYKNL